MANQQGTHLAISFGDGSGGESWTGTIPSTSPSSRWPAKKRMPAHIPGLEKKCVCVNDASAQTMTTYPFSLPADLQQRLPSPSSNGNRYVDVRVAGKWDGVLVIDSAGMCIGIYTRGRVERYPLPFDPAEIEDIRPASLWNRCLASLPFDLWDAAVLTIIAISPASLALAWLMLPALAVVSVVACSVSIYIMYLAPGFPFLRLPVAVCGLCQIVIGVSLVVRSLW
jgi:hypothetical protein